MYGLVVENLSEYIKAHYGEDMWEDIRRKANVEQPSFSTHKVYNENLIPKLIKNAAELLGITTEELMFGMGEFFIEFVGQYGYDRVLSVLGRHYRDFLNGLDNLHEYLKFSYPRMKPPSFFCESESSTGMMLHYRSKRRGYAHYTMGQITMVAKHFYDTDVEVELLQEEFMFDTSHVVFQLTFDNQAFSQQMTITLIREEQTLPLRGNMLFEIFPFCILFGNKMLINYIGNSLMQILPDMVGKNITEYFDLVRPITEFGFNNILRRTNNIFEILTVSEAFQALGKSNGEVVSSFASNDDDFTQSLRLKGQMMYMDDWKLILFLATPVMPDLETMTQSGLYINDLSMHDFSRDLMLAGTQQSVELKLALDQEQLKSKKLEESMKKLDDEMRRTDELLYQMIPKQVAQRLRKGENPVDTCETFEHVTILFSDVVTFTEICSRITPMEVVSMLNAMYSIFDNLTEKHKVYKVETIGDAYMVVAGAPERQPNHGEMVCDMALDMVEAITELQDPSTGNHLRIRVGVHTGMVVAGVVGLKMPRYCLFGDAVNTASRMESTSEAMKIHLSETTSEIISPKYQVEERSTIQVKGKGDMKTFWLTDCDGRTSIKGKVTLPQTIVDESKVEERRGSNVSRNYSPITFEDVARRSLTTTPTPSITTTMPPPEVVKAVDNKPRGRSFSNVGFSGVTVPIINSAPKPSPTDEHTPQVLSLSPPHENPEGFSERIRSTTHEKPTSSTTSNSLAPHHIPSQSTSPASQLTNHSINPTVISQHSQKIPLPDVLIDNHHQHNDKKVSEVSEPLQAVPLTPIVVKEAKEVVDRGTSPIVSHATGSGITPKNRVHSHTCILL